MTAIVVLGAPCSGTEKLAAVLHTLGVSMGKRFDGSYEDLDWRDFNRTILKHSGATPLELPKPPPHTQPKLSVLRASAD